MGFEKVSGIPRSTQSSETLCASSGAMQIFGGKGVCQDTLIPTVITRARFCRIADGPDEVHMSQLGKITLRDLAES